ncbi:MAG: hypothetical protein E7254_03505 [Lachnospiraceae bacterium]|nr:hypothetical protein [Lachnospiraceae bacterium]
MRLVTRFFCIVKKEYSNDVNRYYDIGCVQSTAFEIFYYDGMARSYGLMPFAELFGGDFLCLDDCFYGNTCQRNLFTYQSKKLCDNRKLTGPVN